MTKEIAAAIQRKKRMWRKAKQGREVNEYKQQEGLVKWLIRNAKRNFEKRLACEMVVTAGLFLHM